MQQVHHNITILIFGVYEHIWGHAWDIGRWRRCFIVDLSGARRRHTDLAIWDYLHLVLVGLIDRYLLRVTLFKLLWLLGRLPVQI